MTEQEYLGNDTEKVVYSVTGPLNVIKVFGNELIPGDVFRYSRTNEYAVVLRSYSLPHLRLQSLDIETGEIDSDGDAVSPLATVVNMDAEFIIYRARL